MQQSNTCQGGLVPGKHSLYILHGKRSTKSSSTKIINCWPLSLRGQPPLPSCQSTLSCTCAHPVFPQLIQPDLEELSLRPALRGAGFIGKLLLLSACKGQGCCVSSCDSLLNSLPAPCRPCLTQIFKPAQWQHYHENSRREVREVLLN